MDIKVIMSQVANLLQYYQKWIFEEKKTFLRTLQLKPMGLSLIIFFLLLEQKKMVAKMWA